MSKIALSGNPSGTGTFTIASPNSNTDRTLTLPDNTGTVLTSASSLAAANLTGRVPAANAPLGSVIQVVQAFKSDTFSTNSIAPNWVDITGLSLNITPSSSNSRILVMTTCSLGANLNVFSYLRLMRNSTPLFLGDAASNRAQPSAMFYMGNNGTIGTVTINFVDTPATTSQVTYKMQLAAGENGAIWINRSLRDEASTSYDTRQASSIIAMEIAA